MQGVGVESHVLAQVAGSTQSVPSGGSPESEKCKEQDQAVRAGAASQPSAQPAAASKPRKGFPPLVPRSQPQSTAAAVSGPSASAAAAGEAGADGAAQLAPGDPRSSEEGAQTQQSTKRPDDAVDRSSSASGGGRRWFRMFGGHAKAVAAEGVNGRSDVQQQDSAGASLVPQEMSGLPLQRAADRRLSDAPSLAGSSGSGQAHELARLSSEAAQRRVGPHAVFNPTTMMSAGDAKFLDDVRSSGPEATSSPAGASGAALPAGDETKPTGGKITVSQSRMQPQTMVPSSDGSQKPAEVVQAAGQAQAPVGGSQQKSTSASIDGATSPTEKSSGSTSGGSQSGSVGGHEITAAARHFFHA